MKSIEISKDLEESSSIGLPMAIARNINNAC